MHPSRLRVHSSTQLIGCPIICLNIACPLPSFTQSDCTPILLNVSPRSRDKMLPTPSPKNTDPCQASDEHRNGILPDPGWDKPYQESFCRLASRFDRAPSFSPVSDQDIEDDAFSRRVLRTGSNHKPSRKRGRTSPSALSPLHFLPTEVSPGRSSQTWFTRPKQITDCAGYCSSAQLRSRSQLHDEDKPNLVLNTSSRRNQLYLEAAVSGSIRLSPTRKYIRISICIQGQTAGLTKVRCDRYRTQPQTKKWSPTRRDQRYGPR